MDRGVEEINYLICFDLIFCINNCVGPDVSLRNQMGRDWLICVFDGSAGEVLNQLGLWCGSNGGGVG
jgi:hypothetical protein